VVVEGAGAVRAEGGEFGGGLRHLQF
jgi:hypothetical protein